MSALFSKIVKLAFCSTIGTLLLACTQEQQQTNVKPTQVTMAIDLWPGYYPAIIAKERGIFKKHNLDVTIDLPNNTNRMLANFAAGQYQFIAVSLGDVINLAQQYQQARVIIAADESNGGDAIISTKPITALKGSKIGTNLGGFGELFVREMLKQQSINVDEVELVNIDASNAPELINQQKIDFAHTWHPYIDQAKKYGASVVFSSQHTPGLITDVVVVRGEFASTNGQAVSAFTTAWFEAQTWWRENRAQGNKIIGATLQQNPNTISLDGIKLLNSTDNKTLFNVESVNSLHSIVTMYNDFYIEQGILKQPINASLLLNETYLP